MKSLKYCVYFVMPLGVLSLLANAKIIRTDEDEFVYMNRIAIGTKTPDSIIVIGGYANEGITNTTEIFMTHIGIHMFIVLVGLK